MSNTPIRTIRMSDKNWKALQYIAKSLGYPDVTSLIRAIACGEVEIKHVEQNNKDFNWGA